MSYVQNEKPFCVRLCVEPVYLQVPMSLKKNLNKRQHLKERNLLTKQHITPQTKKPSIISLNK
jgi:hypothetical protein